MKVILSAAGARPLDTTPARLSVFLKNPAKAGYVVKNIKNSFTKSSKLFRPNSPVYGGSCVEQCAIHPAVGFHPAEEMNGPQINWTKN